MGAWTATLKLHCGYKYTRPCMINCIWSLKQLWLQVSGHPWFHLHGLRWPVRNGEGRKFNVLSHLYIRILLDYKFSNWYLTSMAERSNALTFLSLRCVTWFRIPLETYIFILNFSFSLRSSPFRTSQRSPCQWNPVVIAVFDPGYD